LENQTPRLAAPEAPALPAHPAVLS